MKIKIEYQEYPFILVIEDYEYIPASPNFGECPDNDAECIPESGYVEIGFPVETWEDLMMCRFAYSESAFAIIVEAMPYEIEEKMFDALVEEKYSTLGGYEK